MRDEELTLYTAADLLYWLAANNPIQRQPLYWSQAKLDECVQTVKELRLMLERNATRRRMARMRRAARTS